MFVGEVVMAALRRLLPQLIHLRHASEVTRVSTSVVGQTAPKVLDSTVKLTAIAEEDGNRYALRGLVGQTLLKTLVRNKLIDGQSHLLEDVATCGAECEISVAGEWLEKLPLRSEDENEVLKKNTPKGQQVDIHSRLSCQIVLDKKLDGMAFAVPEARPWRTN